MTGQPRWNDDELRAALARQGFPIDGPLPAAGWFGDSPELATELGELVRRGSKKATAGLLWHWEADHGGPPPVGLREVIIDWQGNPLAVIELTEVEVHPFLEVSAAFARDEGEGDGSLAAWRTAHRAYFGRVCASLGRQPSDEMPVVCMRFQVIHAAPDPAEVPSDRTRTR